MDLWSTPKTDLTRACRHLHPGCRVSNLTTGLWVYITTTDGRSVQVNDYQVRDALREIA